MFCVQETFRENASPNRTDSAGRRGDARSGLWTFTFVTTIACLGRCHRQALKGGDDGSTVPSQNLGAYWAQPSGFPAVKQTVPRKT